MSDRLCGELLYDRGVLVSRCTQTWGVEHSHHDLAADEAVRAGVAEKLHPYERGYLEGERHRFEGGELVAGTFDHASASPYSQGYVDGFMQKQGRFRPSDEVIR